MGIKTTLALTFTAIVVMLCANTGVYIWSTIQREGVLERREQILERELTLDAISFALENQRGKAAFLGDLFLGESADPAQAEEAIGTILSQRYAIALAAQRLAILKDAERAQATTTLEAEVAKLSALWDRFYQAIQNDPDEAIGIFILEAEPLTESLLQERIPTMRAFEEQALVAVNTQITAVNRLTTGVSTATFGLTLLLIAGLATISFRAQDRLAAETRARERVTGEREAARKELQTAAHIQTVMLPRDVEIPGYDTALVMQPVTEVGGDFFDHYRDADDHSWISIGDVTGHGLTSGLVMMIAQTVFETVVTQSTNGARPKDIFLTLNTLMYGFIHDRLQVERHITAMILREEGAGNFSYTGAHEAMLVYRAASGQVEQIEVAGGWLGVFPDISFCTNERTLHLDVDDALLLYTDGITEAVNAEEELFGLERLADTLKEHHALPAAGIIGHLMERVEAWTSHHLDDRTCIVMKRTDTQP